jgi:hypothetical protein
LNSNPIKIIHANAFEKMNSLQALKLSNTSIKHLALNSSLKELDLSYLNFSIYDKNELNFYFLQDDYIQKKYQREMETSLERFLALDDDEDENSFLIDTFVNDTFLNNRFMEVI